MDGADGDDDLAPIGGQVTGFSEEYLLAFGLSDVFGRR